MAMASVNKKNNKQNYKKINKKVRKKTTTAKQKMMKHP